MTRTLGAWLGERRVGSFSNVAGDLNVFHFDEEYLDDPAPPVLSQSFIAVSGDTVRVVPRTHRVAPPFFANLLPEADTALRSLIARRYGINRTRDFPFLHVLGRDLPGAVVLRDSDDAGVAGASAPPSDDPAASERPLRFSLAGVQLKFSASVVGQRLTIPVEGIGGSWIAKLPTNAFPRLPHNEYAVMSLARAIGLDVPRIEMFDLDAMEGLPRDLPALRADEPHRVYAIERFDRVPGGGRIHVEDFNQVANQAPADKYDNKNTEWIANVIDVLCPDDDVEEFLRRLVFGVCAGNNDMHLKNWALIYPDGRNARLAPMYDFVCTRMYYPNGSLALTIGGERDFERIDREALRALAKRAHLSPKRTLAVAAEIVAALRETWPSFKETIFDHELVAALERQFAAVPLMAGR
jgi:serine/threonine-protein kinase HipA